MAKLPISTVREMLSRSSIAVGTGETLEALLATSTLNGQPLTERQKDVVRKAVAKLERPKPAKRPGYREAIEWIALNDDQSVIDDGGALVTVSMVANLFDKPLDKVVSDVIAYREKNGG